MQRFQSFAKLWPSGIELADRFTGIDGRGYDITAPKNETVDEKNYKFLFWNTGRHITTKRHVNWSFSNSNWSTWTATRWYGDPIAGPGGDGIPCLRATALSIGGDVTVSPTPINGNLSTFARGAWPFRDDDHMIGTANGPATVVAKDPPDYDYEFAGWVQLIFGGDDAGEFDETDSNIPPNGFGFFDYVPAGRNLFSAIQNGIYDLLAAYGYQYIEDPPLPHVINWIEYLLNRNEFIPDLGDYGPEDRRRLLSLQKYVEKTRPVIKAETDFQTLINTAGKMTKAELKLNLQKIKTTINLGNTALSTIESQIKKTR